MNLPLNKSKWKLADEEELEIKKRKDSFWEEKKNVLGSPKTSNQ